MSKSDRNISGGASVALALLCLAASPVRAQNINVTVDGEVVPFRGQPPVERSGTILVPLRGVFEKLGADVFYDAPTRSILATKGPTTVRLRIGEAVATVNGERRTLLLPAQEANGTTLVPLRFVSEALGADVKWSGGSRTVVITTNAGAAGSIAASPPVVPATGEGDAPTVTSLTHNADHALRAGDVLTVTLTGAPGGDATFTIPGIEGAKSVPMHETQPGTYVGAFTIPRGMTVQKASVLGLLRRGGRTSTTLQAAGSLTVDTIGPTVSNLAPAPGTALPPGKPLIYGTFTDAGTGVATDGTKVLLNGKDVTSQATVTGAFFSLRPETDLQMGKNIVDVLVRDNAGNETRKEWAFTVSAAEALVQELTYSPNGKTLEPGDVVQVNLKAKPGGQARFNIGGTVTDRPMRETSPGNYVGSYTVKKGDSLAEAPVTATFTLNGRTVTQTAGQPVTIAAGAPVKPTILSPTANQSVGDTVTIKGKAAPNATVRYRVRYQGTLLVIAANGTVTEGEVKADAAGNWSVPDVKLSSLPGVRNIVYTVEAEAIGAAGEASEVASVDVKR